MNASPDRGDPLAAPEVFVACNIGCRFARQLRYCSGENVWCERLGAPRWTGAGAAGCRYFSARADDDASVVARIEKPEAQA